MTFKRTVFLTAVVVAIGLVLGPSTTPAAEVIFENGKYYVWYTKRDTPSVPKGPKGCTDTIPSTDWDLAEILW